MDETIIKIVKSKLKRWDGQTIDKEKLETLRDEIFEKTKTNKFAPFANVKKWIKAARKQIAADEKAAAKKAGATPKKAHKEEHLDIKVSPKLQESVDELKFELTEPPKQEVSLPKPQMVLDKVYLQTITYEMASMRSALDRIGRQLDKLERELNQHRQAE